ncbi:MAG: PIN domain-containing protein [Nanoarchaeota archaeon]
MNLVIDANILFSALIKTGNTAKLLLNPLYRFYAPEFIFTEFAKYEKYILEKTHKTKEEFYDILKIFKEIINTISIIEILPFMDNGNAISPDEKDSAYFALAVMLNCPIWSNDKKLKEQNIVKIYSIEELLRI